MIIVYQNSHTLSSLFPLVSDRWVGEPSTYHPSRQGPYYS